MTLVGAVAAAQMPLEAAELASQFIDAAYKSIDSREEDQFGGIPGVTREYHAVATTGKWGTPEYVNAGIEGYGWGALSVSLLLHDLLGLHEEEVGMIKIAPVLSKALRRAGATYRVGPISWGKYLLHIECVVRDVQHYRMRVRSSLLVAPDGVQVVPEQQWEWEGAWGEQRILQLS
jgi:hypothetical protein